MIEVIIRQVVGVLVIVLLVLLCVLAMLTIAQDFELWLSQMKWRWGW